MVGLVIRLDQHAHQCTVNGPVVYQFASREVAEFEMLKLFRDKIVATLEEYEAWREMLYDGELFDIFPLLIK